MVGHLDLLVGFDWLMRALFTGVVELGRVRAKEHATQASAAIVYSETLRSVGVA